MYIGVEALKCSLQSIVSFKMQELIRMIIYFIE